jgi:hypothetical protein
MAAMQSVRSRSWLGAVTFFATISALPATGVVQHPAELLPLWPDAPAIEEFLRDARITSRERLGTGITNPQKLTLERDGVVRHAVYKEVDQDYDSWRYEVAAYELDKLLALGRVPPTVPRSVRGYRGAVQLWVDGQTLSKVTTPPADIEAWRVEVSVLWLFDDLVANIDRHLNNAVITSDFRMAFIDNSKSFQDSATLVNDLNRGAKGTHARYWFVGPATGGPPFPTRYPPALVERLRTVTDQELRKAVGSYLRGGRTGRLLERRRLILGRLEGIIGARPAGR